MGIGDRIGKQSCDRPVLVVAGPTASGKSAAALAIARAFGGTIINADSMQIYRELPVLTAQPTAEERVVVPHQLYGVLSAAERCTAGRWRAMAIEAIAAARAAGALPIIVGGTGLYLKTLIEGLAPVPPIPPEIRAQAVLRRAELGPDAFHAELARVDPVMAARLPPNDAQRVLRAYEVAIATGTSLATFQRKEMPTQDRFIPLVFMPPRAALAAACDARCLRMIEAGALDEVRALLAMRLPPTASAMKAVGVRELARHLDGELGLDDATALFQRATRQYAKRQYTWFRHQLAADRLYDEQFSERIQSEIFSFIRDRIDRLGTGR